MPPKYTLTYFNIQGLRGETARLLFACAGVAPGGVAYEDKRIDLKDWPELKKKVPQGTLPVLDVDGGKLVLSQSPSIMRFLAREFKLYGKTNQDAAIIDQIYDTLVDVQAKAADVFFEKDEEKKATLMKAMKEERMPFFLGVLDAIVAKYGKDGFAVGNTLTLADLALYSTLEFVHAVPALEANKDKFGSLLTNKEKVEKIPKVKAWLDKRPKKLEFEHL